MKKRNYQFKIKQIKEQNMLLFMSQILNKFKLSQLMLILSLLVIFTMLISAFSSINSVHKGVIAIEHQSLASHVTSIGKLLATRPEQYQSLKEILYPARWNHDNSGYAFLVNGTTGKMMIYPPNSAKEGEDVREINLIEGGTLAQAIMRSSQRGIAEMVHYNHIKPGQEEVNLKAAYLYPLKQGGAVLIAGTYLDKADRVLLKIYKEMFIPLALITLFVLVFVYIFTQHINHRANYLSLAMSRLSDGNLRDPIELQGKDEMAFLAKSLNVCQKGLAEILKLQADNGTSIATASLQIDSSLQHTNQLVRSELGNLGQLASAMEQMVCSIGEVAENAASASKNAQSTDNRTHQGEEQIQQCIQSIKQLCDNLSDCTQAVIEVKDGVVSIDSVVETIHAISEQTNMLALNAAIEAARAGEHGRGFAVVADEVRQLASRTQEATKEITETIGRLNTQALSTVTLVENSVSTAEIGMDAAKSAGNEFIAITDNISSLNDSSLQIATAAEQQRNVALTMSQNINHLNTELGETSQDLNELSGASNSLKEQTDLLEEQLSHFNFERNEQHQQKKELVSSRTLALN